MTQDISFFNARRSIRLPIEKEGYNRIIVDESQKKLSQIHVQQNLPLKSIEPHSKKNSRIARVSAL